MTNYKSYKTEIASILSTINIQNIIYIIVNV